jgi:hypothetical protein
VLAPVGSRRFDQRHLHTHTQTHMGKASHLVSQSVRGRTSAMQSSLTGEPCLLLFPHCQQVVTSGLPCSHGWYSGLNRPQEALRSPSER